MAHPTLRQQAVESGVKVVPLEAPAQLAFGRTLIDVLAPLSDYIPGDIPKNNDSLVLRIRYGSRSFLLTGGAETPAWRLGCINCRRQRISGIARHLALRPILRYR